MVELGMMIGDRYEILDRIGTGGMSDVYKAKCHKLNRFVAVKVLKQEFSENADFVSKFRIEAQAAAGLMHPNIVNVYDVGEENGIYYIVMELVEGITLKKYIEKKSRLSYKETVSIAIQISMGIEAAHNNNIIHRDIKPQNIIISREGKVKVTDFGIAKAATSNTITSNVMGSVHYTSPEQARGGYSDEKSDIYSLGITIFEMLTGRVPFNGETTVAIAIKHIQEEMTPVSEFVSDVPVSMENIVLKCCQKSPDRRYQSMPEVIADLKQSLLNPDIDIAVSSDADEESGTRMLSEEDLSEIKKKTIRQDAEAVPVKTSARQSRQQTGRIRESEYDEDDEDPGMEKLTTILAIGAGIIICIIILVLLGKILGFFQNENGESGTSDTPLTSQQPSGNEYVDELVMPDVKGWDYDQAKAALERMGLVVEPVYVESETYEANVVINASIPKGDPVSVGATVSLTVSKGTEAVLVPNTEGKTYEEAYSMLTEAGFKINRAESYSGGVEKGKIISQKPVAGETCPKGTTVTVIVSIGMEVSGECEVPYLIGMDEATAKAALEKAGLVVGGVSDTYHNDIANGLVCYQSYSKGTYLAPGTTVDIVISKGVENATYRCNLSIEAPTAQEAPDYVPGSQVHMILTADNSKILMDIRTESFPYAINHYGITASGGILTFEYTVPAQNLTTVDPVTGETIVISGEAQTKTFQRRVEFVKE